MNCRRFQHTIYEYLDRSLSPRAQAAAEEHLSACAACRQIVSRERQLAQSLSENFRGAADSLQLPPEVGRRVLAALAEQRHAPREEQDKLVFWRRWALPLEFAASGLLLLAGFFFFVRAPGPGAVHPQPHLAQGGISLQFSYVVPTYTFRQESGSVIDALTYQTNVVNERLPASRARLK